MNLNFKVQKIKSLLQIQKHMRTTSKKMKHNSLILQVKTTIKFHQSIMRVVLELKM